MNLEKLNNAKKLFYSIYPNGFNDEKMKEIEKKHKPQKMFKMVNDLFTPDSFDNADSLLSSWVKVVNNSSMVSIFEKPKFKDLCNYLPPEEKDVLVNGLKEFLYGDRSFGFQSMVDILQTYKLAKWTLISVVPYYLKPEIEVFIKPTTTKMAIDYFELKNIKYSPKPTFEFYESYRKEFIKMKEFVDVTNDNSFFGGFIMIVTGL